MEYEIINLVNDVHYTKAVSPVRLKNSDPDAGTKIGNAWRDFLGKLEEFPSGAAGKPIAIYSNYESDETGEYDFQIGCEALDGLNNEDFGPEFEILPHGKYAKFVLKGNVNEIVPVFWQELWQMDLPRKFGFDFEEYQSTNLINGEVHFFISLL
jgi:predicted transcriptional regulator YdeE